MLMNFPEMPIFPPTSSNSVPQTMITYQERERIFCLRNLSSRKCHSLGRIFSIVEFSGEQLFPSTTPTPGSFAESFQGGKLNLMILWCAAGKHETLWELYRVTA
ncbi:hypothetical protein CEXT_157741 [Caerostris extrusa]|uniref:Uncharacterized protein n=1 Tax=Caerostris extrusa TaxID=172846 RepID=A0AAV4PTD1_CAEEX|nr:hypothetical protein CEXT_157741 [Caerostris extrusa]